VNNTNPSNTNPINVVKNKKLVPEIDFLRAGACLCVILIHVTANPLYFAEPGSSAQLVYLIANQFTRFSVPAFIFITGFTLATTYLVKGTPFHYSSFLKSRLTTILTPYLIWSVTYYVYLHFYEPSHSWSGYVIDLIKTILLGSAAYHLYFIVLICQFYIFAPIFLFLFKKYAHPGRLLALGGILQLAATIYNYHFVTLPGIPLLDALIQYLDRNFLLWAGYFILGMGLAVKLSAFRAWITRYRIWLLAASLFTWAGLVLEFLHSTQAGHPLAGVVTSVKPLVFLYTASAIPVLFWLQPKITSAPLKNFYTQISRYSFGIYLCHPLLIWLVQIVVVYTAIQTTIPIVVLTYMFCAAISFVLVYNFDKLSLRLRIKFKPRPSLSSVPGSNPSQDFISQ